MHVLSIKMAATVTCIPQSDHMVDGQKCCKLLDACMRKVLRLHTLHAALTHSVAKRPQYGFNPPGQPNC